MYHSDNVASYVLRLSGPDQYETIISTLESAALRDAAHLKARASLGDAHLPMRQRPSASSSFAQQLPGRTGRSGRWRRSGCAALPPAKDGHDTSQSVEWRDAS